MFRFPLCLYHFFFSLLMLFFLLLTGKDRLACLFDLFKIGDFGKIKQFMFQLILEPYPCSPLYPNILGRRRRRTYSGFPNRLFESRSASGKSAVREN